MAEYVDRFALRDALYDADAITMQGVKIINQFPSAVDAATVRWIPVTERLPENIANRVLVVCERSNGVFYAHYEKPFWINLETDKPFISTVTHWMPLPKPPEEE